MSSIITLLTDFGTADGYAGELKGILLSRMRQLGARSELVDISHDIPPHDVEFARLVVARYWRRFPEGTVHLVVVDPGVGSARRPIAVSSAGRFLVGPDNGVLSPALLSPHATAVELPVPAGASTTFHGRDVFAPTAATLAAGGTLALLGPAMVDPVAMRTPEVTRDSDGSLVGQVIAIDSFGNLVTNLFMPRNGAAAVEVGGRVLSIVTTYSDAPHDTPVALVGSMGLLEIAVREGRASVVLGVERDATVRLRPRS